MKRTRRLLSLSSGLLAGLLGLLFLFVEARFFFSFDWLSFSHPIWACFKTLFRLLAALLGVADGVLSVLVFFRRVEGKAELYRHGSSLGVTLLGFGIALYFLILPGAKSLFLILPFALCALLALGSFLADLFLPSDFKKAE